MNKPKYEPGNVVLTSEKMFTIAFAIRNKDAQWIYEDGNGVHAQEEEITHVLDTSSSDRWRPVER